MADFEPLLLHFLMKEYGGYPDRWLEQDWAKCEALLQVNSSIQKIQARERKKKQRKSSRGRGKRKR